MFSIGIVAHQDREGMAEELKAQVDADFMSVDTGHLGPGTNHRLVWATLLHGTDAPWCVVLEEDALPVKDFGSQLHDVLLAAPSPVVSLYLGRLRPPQYQALIQDALTTAQATDAHWITSTHCLHAVGLAIRTELVADMLDSLKPYLPIDAAIGRWARQCGHQIAYTVPSLVDHADVPTLIAHPDGKDRTAGRVAWQLGSRTRWNSTTVALQTNQREPVATTFT